MIFVSQWQWTGYIMALFMVAIRAVPRDLYEAMNKDLREGALNDKEIEIQVAESAPAMPMMEIPGGGQMGAQPCETSASRAEAFDQGAGGGDAALDGGTGTEDEAEGALSAAGGKGVAVQQMSHELGHG